MNYTSVVTAISHTHIHGYIVSTPNTQLLIFKVSTHCSTMSICTMPTGYSLHISQIYIKRTVLMTTRWLLIVTVLPTTRCNCQLHIQTV